MPLPARRTLRDEARDPATVPARLRELSKQGFAKEVAANPNIPLDLLLKLAPRHFDAFLGNAVLPLLLLEDPGLFLKLSASALRKLLRRDAIPENVSALLGRHEDAEVRDSALLHIRAAGANDTRDPVLRSLGAWRGDVQLLPEFFDLGLVPSWLSEPLAGSTDPELRDAVVKALERSSDTEAAQLGKLYRRAGATLPERPKPSSTDLSLGAAEMLRLATGGPWARAIAARHPNTPPEALALLARDRSVTIRRHALRHPFTPEEALWAGSASVLVALRMAVARNRGAPDAILARLAGDANPAVRRAVASHPYLEPAALKVLAGDGDASIRARVARQRLTPADVIEKLSVDPDANVRSAAASHPSLPPATYERLVSDKDKGVREAMARRVDLPNELLAQLLCDEDRHIRHCARFNRSNPRDLTWELMHIRSEDHEGIRRAILRGQRRVRQRKAPTPRARQFSYSFPKRYWSSPRDPHQSEKQRAALNRDTPPEVLARLAQERNEWVLRALAGNHSTPPEVLRRLANIHETTQHIRSLAMNPNTPADVLETLARHWDSSTRKFVAYNPRTPAYLMAELARHKDVAVRRAVAGVAHAPAEVLLALCDDPDVEIHKALLRNSTLPWSALARWLPLVEQNVEWRQILAYRPDLPPDWRTRLMHDPEVPVRMAFAQSASRTREEFQVLSKDREASVRGALALSLVAWSAESLEQVAEGASVEELEMIARAQKISTPLAERLASHSDPRVRIAIAGNVATPDPVLARLAEDADAEVRNALRHHPRCPPQAVDRWLAEGPYDHDKIFHIVGCKGVREHHYRKLLELGGEDARKKIVFHEHTPLKIIEELFQSGDVKGLEHIAKNRRLPDVMYEAIIALENAPALRHYTAVSYFTPREVAERIALTGKLEDFWERRTRVALARMPEARPEFLLQLFERELTAAATPYSYWYRRRFWEDESAPMRALIARGEIPVEKLEPLLSDSRVLVRRAMLARCDLPAAWRDRLRRAALDRATKGRASWARLAALCHSECDVKCLRSLARTGRWLERLAVGRNPAAPGDVLDLLSTDSNRVVRAEARARLNAFNEAVPGTP